MPSTPPAATHSSQLLPGEMEILEMALKAREPIVKKNPGSSVGPAVPSYPAQNNIPRPTIEVGKPPTPPDHVAPTPEEAVRNFKPKKAAINAKVVRIPAFGNVDDMVCAYEVHVDGKKAARCTTHEKWDGCLWIYNLFTEPEFRKQGLARKLLAAVEEDNRGRRLRLTAQPYTLDGKEAGLDLAPLVGFYESLGFTQFFGTSLQKQAQNCVIWEKVVETRFEPKCPNCNERIPERGGLLFHKDANEWEHRSCGNRFKWSNHPKVASLEDVISIPEPMEKVAGNEGGKGCLMAYLPTDFAANVVDWIARKTEDKTGDLASDGIEHCVHTTVLYGFTGDVTHDEIDRVLNEAGIQKVDLKLGKVSRFSSSDYDVVKVGVESPDLHAINTLLRDKFGDRVKVTFPDYKPHMTLFYCKKGTFKEMDDHAKFEGDVFRVRQLVYSTPGSDKKIIIKLRPPEPKKEEKTGFWPVLAVNTKAALKVASQQKGLQVANVLWPLFGSPWWAAAPAAAGIGAGANMGIHGFKKLMRKFRGEEEDPEEMTMGEAAGRGALLGGGLSLATNALASVTKNPYSNFQLKENP